MICGNRIQDLQPSLASAVKSIPRWHFIQSSLPYILQCCSALLANRTRLGNSERLGNAEKDLLYTLHWILAEAPSVCCVIDKESLLFPLTTIEQFVHLLAPHVHTVREDDLTFRLVNGTSLWRALWNHFAPPFTPFTTPVIHSDDEDDDTNESPSWQNVAQNSRNSVMETSASTDFSAASFFDVAVLKCLFSHGWSEEGIVWGLCYLADYLKREFDLPMPDWQKEAEKITFTVECHDSSHESVVGGQPDELSHKSIGIKESEPLAKRLGDKEDGLTVEEEKKKLQPKENVQKTPGMLQENGEASKSDEAIQRDDGGSLVLPGLERTPSGTKLRIRVKSSPVLSNGGRVFAAVASPPAKGSVAHYELRSEKALSDSAVISNTKVFIRPTSSASSGDDNKQNALPGKCIQTAELVNGPFTTSNSIATDSLFIPGAPKTEDSRSRGSPKDNEFAIPTQSALLVVQNFNSQKVQDQLKTDPPLTNAITGSSPKIKEDPSQSVLLVSPVAKLHDTKKDQNIPPSTDGSSNNQCNPASNPKVGVQTPTHSTDRDSYVRTERYRVYPGAAEYITNDGRLSTLVILQALNGILRENPTSRVCDAVSRVFNCLVKINEKHKGKKRDSVSGIDDRTVAETRAIGFRSPHSDNILGRLRASFYGRPPGFLSLAMGCVFSLIKALGCPLGKYRYKTVFEGAISATPLFLFHPGT